VDAAHNEVNKEMSMKRLLLAMSLLLLSCEWKPGYLLEVKNFHLDYKSGYGKGGLQLSLRPSLDELPFELVQHEGHFIYRIPGVEVVWDEVPTILRENNILQIDDFSLYAQEGSYNFHLKEFYSVDRNSHQILKSLQAHCYGDNRDPKILNQIIHNCSKSSKLSFHVYEDEEDFEITDAKINILNHKLNLEAYIYSEIIGKFKLWGAIHYLQETNQVRVKVDKVKMGILSITSIFFKLLENQQRDSFQVKKPYLYFNVY
jgi:hypothetical protein